MAFGGAKGISGEVRRGGRLVATLGRWEATRDRAADTWSIAAGVTERHPVWAQDGPHEVVLHVGDGGWRWRGAEVAFQGDASAVITARGRFESLRGT